MALTLREQVLDRAVRAVKRQLDSGTSRNWSAGYALRLWGWARPDLDVAPWTRIRAEFVRQALDTLPAHLKRSPEEVRRIAAAAVVREPMATMRGRK